VILDDPFEDPPSLEIPVGSPPPTEEMLASTRIGADEDLVSYNKVMGASGLALGKHIT
jgi:hypothetical protein